jgi:hypothetical protein
MGVNRDLKKATEAYWGGKLSQADLLAEGKRLRLAHWEIQKKAGVDSIPSNDFAFYDQVLHQIQDFGVSFCTMPRANKRKANLTFHRLLHLGIPNTTSTLSMNTSLWAVVCNVRVLTFHHWKW